MYEELYGFIVPKTIIGLTFNNVKKELLKYIKKNKKIFLELVKDHIEIYDSIKNDK